MQYFLLKRAEEDWDYDQYHGFVIAAKDEAQAREIAQERAGWPNWKDPTRVTCTVLTKPKKAGIILADFHAG